MNPANIKDIKKELEKHGFSFKKSLGQNFLIDPTVCPRMAEASADKTTGVLEIGPGAGVLTRELSRVAKRVVSVELDRRLQPVLEKVLDGCDNAKVIFNDIMKVDIHSIIAEEFSDCEKISVCANLPYYITSPILMMLLENKYPIDNITVMIQKEAADRICAKVGSREAGAVTAAVSYYAEAYELFGVGRTSFIPQPNVDSCVIKLDVRKEPAIKIEDEKAFFKVVKACFAQRRKTLVNTVSNTLGVSKEEIKAALWEMGLQESVRGETLTMEQLAFFSNKINIKR